MTNPIQSLLDFIAALERDKLWYRIQCERSEAIMVEVVIPGEHWEVEFFADGSIEFEAFRSDGNVAETTLDDLRRRIGSLA